MFEIMPSYDMVAHYASTDVSSVEKMIPSINYALSNMFLEGKNNVSINLEPDVISTDDLNSVIFLLENSGYSTRLDNHLHPTVLFVSVNNELNVNFLDDVVTVYGVAHMPLMGEGTTLRKFYMEDYDSLRDAQLKWRDDGFDVVENSDGTYTVYGAILSTPTSSVVRRLANIFAEDSNASFVLMGDNRQCIVTWCNDTQRMVCSPVDLVHKKHSFHHLAVKNPDLPIVNIVNTVLTRNK